jgi:hypothetical protein
MPRRNMFNIKELHVALGGESAVVILGRWFGTTCCSTAHCARICQKAATVCVRRAYGEYPVRLP